MKHLQTYHSFSASEMRAIRSIESLRFEDPINESISEWTKKASDFIERANDSIRNLMLAMMEKGFQSLHLIKNLFSKILDKISEFKEKNPVLFRTIIITLILIVLLFVLCSAASTPTKVPSEGVLNAAIGLLEQLRKQGAADDSTMMKAQAYLLELKKGGSVDNPIFRKGVIAAAKTAMQVVENNLEQLKSASGEDKAELQQTLIDLVEKGSKLVGYKIIEYQNSIGKYAGETTKLFYK